MNTLFISSICLLALYIFSSYQKIMDVNGTAASLQKKVPMISMNLCVLAIILVILLEGAGSCFLLYSTYTNKYKNYAYYTVIAFILFNIMATVLYHNPFTSKEFTNFLKNLSITGGFILLLDALKY